MIKGNVVRTEKEYRKLDRLSASDLRLFAKDRKKFFKTVVMKEEEWEEEEYSKSLLVGGIVHTLLLEPQNFDTKYLMSICQTPPTGLMLVFVEALYKYTKINTVDGEVVKDFKYLAEEAYRESGFKITLDAVLKKFIGSNAEDYYNEIRQARSLGKIVVCVDDLSIAEKIVNNLESHPFTGHIFKEDEHSMSEVKIEDYEIDGVELKSMIDRLEIDDIDLRVQPYDVKVVWDNQNFYREYYLKRRADIQAYVYWKAVQSRYPDQEVLPPIFIVADSANFYAPLKYQMTEEALNKAYHGFEDNGRYYIGVKDILDEIKWAQETGSWTYSKDDYENDGFKLLV